eukprot:EG_transcript_5784
MRRLPRDWQSRGPAAGFAEDRSIPHRALRVPRPQSDFPTFDEICAACGGTRWRDGNPPRMGEEPGCDTPTWIPAAQLYGAKACFKAISTGAFKEMDPDDINQGEVGDCWFLAGLAGAALFEDQLMRLVCTRRDDTLGVFEFTFRPEGRAIKVCVDDGVPIVTGLSGKRVAYCHSRTEGELWPILVEKAYAKLYGGYQAISGGLQAHAISDLLGVEYFFIFLKFPDKQKYVDAMALSNALQNYAANNVRMGCSWVEVSSGAGGAFGETTAADGLVAGHAYTILKVHRASADGRLYLNIRNPHGRGEWHGAYSDNWAGWGQYPALRQELDVQRKDDGAFWMHIDDFARNCQTLNCNPPTPLVDKGLEFKSQGRGPLPGPGGPGQPVSPQPFSPQPVGPQPPSGPSTTCRKCSTATPYSMQLPPEYAQGLYNCDVCRTLRTVSNGVYHCPSCGWDCCPGCAGGGPAPAPSPAPAPGGYACSKCRLPITRGTALPPQYTDGMFRCDVCSSLFSSSGGVYHCASCGWDSCLLCIGKDKPSPSPNPPPAPSAGAPSGRPRHCRRCRALLAVTTFLPAEYPDNIFRCDLCQSLHFGRDGVYHCQGCQWDGGLACLNAL